MKEIAYKIKTVIVDVQKNSDKIDDDIQSFVRTYTKDDISLSLFYTYCKKILKINEINSTLEKLHRSADRISKMPDNLRGDLVFIFILGNIFSEFVDANDKI